MFYIFCKIMNCMFYIMNFKYLQFFGFIGGFFQLKNNNGL